MRASLIQRSILMRPVGFLTALVLICAAAVAAVLGGGTAAVAAALNCTTSLYQLSSTELRVGSVPFSAVGTTATVTAAQGFALPSDVSTPNSLGINSDGTHAYFTGLVGGAVQIFDYNTVDGTIIRTAAPAALQSRVAGAVNPVNGLFYFGGTAAGSAILAYDPDTSAVFQAGTVPSAAVPGSPTSANGDYAFSSAGDLFIVSNASLVSVAAASVPQRNTTTQLPGTLISSGAFNVSNGVAFDSAGSLYVENGSSGGGTVLQKVNPVTGAVVGVNTTSSLAGVDLASCAAPSTLTLQKNVQSRVNAADQFTLNIGSAGSSGISATTSGTATGVQAAKAGPTIGITGTTYTLSEAGAGGANLAAYGTTYQCVDEANNDEVVASGAAASFALTYPPGVGRSIVCTFSNTALTQSYSVRKSASATSATPGAPLTYTVTVENTGQRAYTAANPASFTDDLSDVLDDATYNGDASDGATVNGTTLSWSGALAAGQTRTITYSVTPKNPSSASDTGNLELNNQVTPTGPGGTCVTGQCTTSTPVQSLLITKTADQTDVIPGSTISYTVTVKNTGKVDYTTGSNAASFSDDLSKVLDDANWNDDATASAGTVSYDAPTLSWSGPVAAGATVTVKYSVTVKDPDTGDSQIDNAVTSVTPGNNCVAGNTDPACSVQIPSASYTVQKSASSQAVNPGDTITYTVTVTNTGQRAYTTDRPASFRDDLSDVTDDATYVSGSATNGATVDGDTLTWSGPLAIGATETITYQVKVNDPDTGD
ncbi:putative repeat protein (TIGR01451 family), partial [Curtobacterium sp. 1544]